MKDDQRKMLDAPLSSTHVKTRKQAGRTLSYLEGWVAIAEANRIFGYDGWTRETVYCKEISRQEVIIGKGGQYEKPGFKVGYEAKVRVEALGTVREGTGHGSASMADLFDCIESAAKEAETDAMKRALMTFGNQFGLALYDKEQRNVSRDGGMSGEADQQMADNINKYTNKLKESANAIESLPKNEQEWKAWGADYFYPAVTSCSTIEALDAVMSGYADRMKALEKASTAYHNHLMSIVDTRRKELNTVLGG